ncbi:MAG TPA: hypothetical protein VK821_01760 [Dehalococcoidia bacterium]|nr:hypothetical protein [Dehalococcoidia bacterium]
MKETRTNAAGDPVDEAINFYKESLAELQPALTAMSKHVAAGEIADERSLAAFSRVWRTVSKRHRRAQMLFADLTEFVEDVYDSVEAQKAREEPGESVPWEQVKAELGLS